LEVKSRWSGLLYWVWVWHNTLHALRIFLIAEGFTTWNLFWDRIIPNLVIADENWWTHLLWYVEPSPSTWKAKHVAVVSRPRVLKGKGTQVHVLHGLLLIGALKGSRFRPSISWLTFAFHCLIN
jgi:hypothetical protein